MPVRDLGCFGKLPYRLLEELQRRRGGAPWQDAVPIRGLGGAVVSIDTVSLPSDGLQEAVALSLLHAMNDIYAANALPASVSVSLILPSQIDLDEISALNSIIDWCASSGQCEVGKLHTIRSEIHPLATVAVVGRTEGLITGTPKEGFVLLLGDFWSTAGELRDRAIANLERRRGAVHSIASPKKDVSGDGLAGALIQMAVRHNIRLSISTESIRGCSQIVPSDHGVGRNFLDYGGLLGGGAIISELIPWLFSPQVFGPLICLVPSECKSAADLGTIIGSFNSGSPRVELATS